MISPNDLTPNIGGIAVANALIIAKLCDLLVKNGIVKRQEMYEALQEASTTLGNDFTGRPNDFAATKIIYSVMAKLPPESQQ
jgi:hypothetical protein